MAKFKPGLGNAMERLSAAQAHHEQQKAAGQTWTVYHNGLPLYGCPNEAAARAICKQNKRVGYTCSPDKTEHFIATGGEEEESQCKS